MEFCKTIADLFSYGQLELKTGAACSCLAISFSFLVGGFDAPLKALLVLVILDYGSGMLAAWKIGVLHSSRGFKGLVKKAVIIAIVAFANCIDVSMQLEHLLRNMAIFGYAGMEALSVIENVDRMGYGEYIPAFIRQKLIELREEKGGGNVNENHN